MPPFFFDDDEDPEPVAPEEAVPALEALAADNGLRDLSLKRFDADEPPPYESSTDPEDYDHDNEPEGLLDKVLEILDRPLNDSEIEKIATGAHHLLSPAEAFYGDALREDERTPFSESFRQIVGFRRRGLLVRHVLKNRWRKLGVWNNAWGFAGRNVSPKDRYRDWRWKWEPQGDENREAVEATRKQLVTRALRLRQTLRRGEHAPGAPLSHLEPDSTVSQAEAFLISRPWFVFRLEMFEDTMRANRLYSDTRITFKDRLSPSVKERWQERGEWRREFQFAQGYGVDVERVTSWKWRHESPSPEPEDVSCITKPLQSVGLRHYHEDLGFTPSEFDEIEVLERDLDEQPENSWIVQDSDFDQPPIPGQVHRSVEEERRLPALAPNSANNAIGIGILLGHDATWYEREQTRLQNLRNEPEEPRESDELEPQDEPEQPVIPAELPQQSVLTGTVHEESKQSNKDASSPAPRQSARAAASRKRKAEAPLPEPLPPKRLRQTKAPATLTTRSCKGQGSISYYLHWSQAGATGWTALEDREARGPGPDTSQRSSSRGSTRTGRSARADPKGGDQGGAFYLNDQGRSQEVRIGACGPAGTSCQERNSGEAIGRSGQGEAACHGQSVIKEKSTEEAPQATPRRGRPARAQPQSEEEKGSTAIAKVTEKNKPAAPEETATPRQRGRPTKAAAAAAAATPSSVPKKSKSDSKEAVSQEDDADATPRRGRPSKTQAREKKAASAAVAALAKGKQGQETAPEESVVTPRRGRPSKAATPATAALAKSERPAVPEEAAAVVTPRRGRPSKAATTAAAAAAAAENAKPPAPEETVTPRTRGRPSKVTTELAAENDETSVSEETVTPRTRGRPSKAAIEAAAALAAGTPPGNGKLSVTKEAATPSSRERLRKAAAILAATAAAAAAAEMIEEAAHEESGDVTTPRRRGRPTRRQAAPGQEAPAPAPASVPAATTGPKGETATSNKKSGVPPRIATPQQWVANRDRVSKRTAATKSGGGGGGGSKPEKAVVPAASPATRGRGRPKKA
ncbi:hypothetical protein PG989_001872 [Apiospora arundinis]